MAISCPIRRRLHEDLHHAPMPLAGLLLDALFPDACLACLAPKDASFRFPVACNACLHNVALPSHTRCGLCDAPATHFPPLCHPGADARLTLAPAGSRVVGDLAQAALYGSIFRAAHPLGELLAAGILASNVPLHRLYVMPAPVSGRIVRERGYDVDRLLAETCAETLKAPLAQHALVATQSSRMTAYGLGTVGDAASANTVVIASVAMHPRDHAAQLSRLARAACPHADILFATCIS